MGMASERKWLSVSQVFTANGTINGVISVASASNFKVKARVIIQSSTQNQAAFEVKNIPNKNTIEVGPIGKDIDERSDVSMYIVADLARITQLKQKRPAIGPGEIDRAVYEEEPIVARRVFPVDEYGDGYTTDNPFPVEATVETTGVVNPHIINFPMPLANIEYAITLPVTAKRYILKFRNSSKSFLSYIPGQTAVNFLTLSCGAVYIEDGLSLSAPLNIYLNNTKAGDIAEIVYWT